jgi:hypothetical protein
MKVQVHILTEMNMEEIICLLQLTKQIQRAEASRVAQPIKKYPTF